MSISSVLRLNFNVITIVKKCSNLYHVISLQGSVNGNVNYNYNYEGSAYNGLSTLTFQAQLTVTMVAWYANTFVTANNVVTFGIFTT